jgi:hypothetical protein
MKRLFAVGALMIALGLVPAAAHAAVITTQTFCVAASDPAGESASCPDGLGATLSISDTNLALNQYDVTLTLDSTLVDTTTLASIISVQFDIEGYSGSDYDVQPPTLDTSLVDGGTWSVFFDNIPGCSADNLNTAHVCAKSTGTGTDTGDIDTWVFHIDLADSLAPISNTVDLNLRAQFLTPDGKNGAILSPDFNNIPVPDTSRGGEPDTGGDQTVPEPTSLVLLGTGLAYAGARLRRRRSE